MKQPTVTVHVSAIPRISAGHSWIYRGEIVDCETSQPGDIVRVRDVRGQYHGQAFYSSLSTIALRLLTRESDPIDRCFWKARLDQAETWRQKLYPGEEVYRLLYSDGDFCSSIIVDRYGPYIVMQTLSQGAERLQALLLDLLLERYQPQVIILRNDVKVRQLEGLPLEKKVVYGTLPESVVVKLGKIFFEVDLLQAQKTGLFLDQRENYLAAAGYTYGRLLDVFSYAGGFALHCAAGAESVECVDISGLACQQADRNAEKNGYSHIRSIADNAFDRLRVYDRQGTRFDSIILDPPAFAKNRRAVEPAFRGYKEINLRALRLLNPGGFLVTCSCSNHISTAQFEEIVQSAAADAQRPVQWVESRGQARDHPWLAVMPETRYLKCLIVRAW